MFIKTTGRRVVIIGGGEQAAQKARLMLKTDAKIVLVAYSLDAELTALVDAGRAVWYQGPLTAEFLFGAAMVFVASGCFAVDVSAHALAKAAGSPVNVVDQPHLCDITTPSLVDRDPVVVAIGTEGTAPVLARQIKTHIERTLPQNLGGLAALAGRLRPSVAKHVSRERRRAFWSWVFSGMPRDLWDRGAETHAVGEIKAAIAECFPSNACDKGALTVIDSSSGDPDLQTLRAVQRLQEADIIFFDNLMDVRILELARRDAERVHVNPTEANDVWIAGWLQKRLSSEASLGRNVVFVTSRLFLVLDHQAAWQNALKTAQTPLEIVPSVGPMRQSPARAPVERAVS
ncbi:MAG: NAD(P)-dependent oxidoreductase [Pseudomonadota bacterium]